MPNIVVSFNHSKEITTLTIPHNRHWRLARACRRCLVDSKAENTKENEKMRKYIVREKITKNIIGIVDMTKDQAKKAQADFIIKEA